MYKGNMYEFVEKLNRFLIEKNSPITISLGVAKPEYHMPATHVLWYHSKSGFGHGYGINDSDDFEEVVLKRTKEYLHKNYGEILQ